MNRIIPIPALNDNYIWLWVNGDNKQAVCIDPGQAAPVIDYLSSHKLQLSAILLTHHHWDHTNGAAELSKRYQATIFGPGDNLSDGQQIELSALSETVQVIKIPGHTLDHVAYYNKDCLFSGDTLFSAGCGRVFEGTFQQMFSSLNTLKQLPAETKVYCGHEYTEANLAFAKQAEPNNPAIEQHIKHCEQLRQANQATLPSTLSLERQINPFLRTDQSAIQQTSQKTTNQPLNTELDVFTALRKWKDRF